MTSHRRIAYNTLWLAVDKIVRMALGIIVATAIARYLGPAQYGELAYVLTLLALLQVVGTLGLDAVVVKELINKQAETGEILGTALCIRALVGATVWVLALIVFNVLGQDKTLTLLAFAGSALVFQAADTIDLWYQSQSASRITVLAKLIAYSLTVGLKLILVFVSAGIWWFALAVSAEYLLAALALYISYRPTVRSQWYCTFKMAKDLLLEGWPILASGLAVTLYMRFDQIMIKNILGEQDLGNYIAAANLSQAWGFLPMIISTSLIPLLAKYKIKNEAQYKALLYSAIFSIFWGGVCISITIALLSDFIVNLLYGAKYTSASGVLKIHVFSMAIASLGVAQGMFLTIERKNSIRLLTTIAAGLFTIMGNYLLLPKMGIIGSAVTAILSQAVAVLIVPMLIEKRLFLLTLRGIVDPRPLLNIKTAI